MEAPLGPYGLSFCGCPFPGCEAWRTECAFEVHLTPEDNGMYYEYMILQAIDLSIIPYLTR